MPTIISAIEPSMSLSTSQPHQNFGDSPCRLTILSAGEAAFPSFISCRRSSLIRPQYLFNSGGFSGAMQASLLTGHKFARIERVVVGASGARSAGAVHGSRARRCKPRRKTKDLPVEGDEKNVRFFETLRKPCGRRKGHSCTTNLFILVDVLETKHFLVLRRSSILQCQAQTDP